VVTPHGHPAAGIDAGPAVPLLVTNHGGQYPQRNLGEGGALDMDDQVKDRITISLRARLTISGSDYALFLDGNFHCSYGPSKE